MKRSRPDLGAPTPKIQISMGLLRRVPLPSTAGQLDRDDLRLRRRDRGHRLLGDTESRRGFPLASHAFACFCVLSPLHLRWRTQGITGGCRGATSRGMRFCNGCAGGFMILVCLLEVEIGSLSLGVSLQFHGERLLLHSFSRGAP